MKSIKNIFVSKLSVYFLLPQNSSLLKEKAKLEFQTYSSSLIMDADKSSWNIVIVIVILATYLERS